MTTKGKLAVLTTKCYKENNIYKLKYLKSDEELVENNYIPEKYIIITLLLLNNLKYFKECLYALLRPYKIDKSNGWYQISEYRLNCLLKIITGEYLSINKHEKISLPNSPIPILDTTTKKKKRRSKKKKNKEKDLNSPKKPLTSFFIYMNERRPQLKNTKENISNIAKYVAEEWKNMKPDNKKIYKDKAYLLREQYKKDKQTYELNKKGITISH